MKRNGLALSFCLWFLLAGCATQPTPPATLTPAENTVTPAPQPTATETLVPQPTATTQPTVVPYVPADGPYLAYFRETDGKRELVLMDTNGKVHKTISLPPEIADFELRLLSPDGNWLAFYTGSAGNLPGQPAPEKFDLALNLLNIKTGETYPLAHLLSKDYPQNFETAAKEIGMSDITPESLKSAFLTGIKHSLAWSPDGRYLAFAGQMEGLSSDLYLYDTRYGTIKRLSNKPEEMQWISWSPDDKWIVHGKAYEAGLEKNSDVYVASLDGTDVRYLSTTSLPGGVDKWLNSHTFFQYEFQNEPWTFGLKLIDVETGEMTKVWDGGFMTFSFDEAGKRILVFAINPDKRPYTNNDADFPYGNYLVNLETHSKTLVVPGGSHRLYMDTNSFGLGERAFSLVDVDSKVLFLTEDGKVIKTKLSGIYISVSPNKNYWFINDNNLIKIFTADDQLVQEIPHPGGSFTSYSITWRPDESGVFFIADGKIYTVGLHSKNFTLVESKLMNNFSPSYKWVGGK